MPYEAMFATLAAQDQLLDVCAIAEAPDLEAA
jgi:hypothetical protein